MKRLRDIGTVLFFLGWVPALILNAWLETSAAFVIPFAVAIIGIVMIFASGIGRLATGAVQLRPTHALRRAPLLIVILVSGALLLRLFLPSTFSAVESAGLAVVMAIFFSLYGTAYRKPE